MKHGLLIYGHISKEADWNILKERIDFWKSKKLEDGSSFFVTVSMSFEKNLLDNSFISQIDSEIDGTFNISLESIYKKNNIQTVQQCIIKGLKNCKEAGMMKTFVINYKFSVRDIDTVFRHNKLACVTLYGNSSHILKTLNPSFMFGKTKTLQRVWENIPILQSLKLEENTFRAFANVVGNSLSLMKVISPEDIGLRKLIN